MRRFFIKIQGIVQGVGFRPFVYKLALSYNLKGWVNNSSEGVYIDVEGPEGDLNTFLYLLKKNPPPLSILEKIEVSEKEILGYQAFTIKKSYEKQGKITLISPDIATCTQCQNEIKDPLNVRYNYAFANCTNCGPRFSIIKSMPYDRNKTTMEKFKMCKSCMVEYKEPSNRRFHAEPTGCTLCGPHLFVTDNNGNKVKVEDPLSYTIEKLLAGAIVAIKGLCGFHLACSGTNFTSIETLRTRKKRPDQPFAVMMKDLDTIKKYCFVTPVEEALLIGIRKPIVLLVKKPNSILPKNIAPYGKTLGVLLPYTPLEEMLFSTGVDVLIMTSANSHDLPLEFENQSAIDHLSQIADFFLLHNRKIQTPLDDSIVKVVNEEPILLRRARGYVPEPIAQKEILPILACGSNMKNTFCIGKEGFLFLSQYNGDLDCLEGYVQYKSNIEHFTKLFSFSPKYVVCDMHPDYVSTKHGESLGLPLLKVQHHHAHIVSCMCENNIENKVIGIAFDGTGYGNDNTIWGGEFLICDRNSYKRIAHLECVKMPGGNKAIEQPWRMAVAYLYKAYEDGIYTEQAAKNIVSTLYGDKALFIWSILKENLNTLETSSMGRLFDGISSLIEIRHSITYEGQASIELEGILPVNMGITPPSNFLKDKIENTEVALSPEKSMPYYSYRLSKKDNQYIIVLSEMIKELLADKANNKSKQLLSIKFHNTIVNFTVDLCEKIKKSTGLTEVALSGGVFQNGYLLTNITAKLKNHGFTVYSHKLVPPNDGGLSLGQIVIANELLKHQK